MARRVPYKVVVSDRARQMLAGHIRFLAEKSPPAARKKKSEIMDAVRSLGTMPERFPFLSAEPLPPNKYRKMFIENWYLILDQIKDQTVYVDFILDCRQDYGWLIKS